MGFQGVRYQFDGIASGSQLRAPWGNFWPAGYERLMRQVFRRVNRPKTRDLRHRIASLGFVARTVWGIIHAGPFAKPRANLLIVIGECWRFSGHQKSK